MADAEIEKVVRTASDRNGSWHLTTVCRRAAILFKAAAFFRSQAADFARLVTPETGKLVAESRGRGMLSADIIGYCAGNAERFLAPHDLEPGAGEAIGPFRNQSPAVRYRSSSSAQGAIPCWWVDSLGRASLPGSRSVVARRAPFHGGPDTAYALLATLALANVCLASALWTTRPETAVTPAG